MTTDRHTRPVLTWRPPKAVNTFIREQAAKHGMSVADWLNWLVTQEQYRTER